ncbi:unnamed protein product [Trifolium pratense]|uniref:Uncharacterized protein n=1 Tax=Trifolium pratense TaxID=57577 RepID=A0ACB0MCI9_TRIPR|nr:unnamed protein product [Trifolium pratense]
MEDGDGDDSEPAVLAMEVEDSDEENKGEMCILNLNHISFENHKTVKFQGQICGVPVLILVDSGATHNFISQKLVEKMGWEVEETPLMNIKLGDGSQTNTKGVCRNLDMQIGDFPLSPAVHLFELGGIDVVLGIEWLKTLGELIVNWRQQTMSFWINKRWVTLKGIDGAGGLGALQSLLCKTKLKSQGVLWGLKNEEHEVEEKLTDMQQKELEGLLQRYQSVFNEPAGLPPRRNKEHAINLVENHSAVNVRAYRYPYHHKNEIERQVQEMLAAGIIRQSTSSFSSPVILLKKKDNTWRMCIDYRALNKVTIPDKFPIPVIEELLDELHGADYYSKLDLKSGYHQVRIWEDISIDFITGLPKSKGFEAILVVVDRLSKYSHFIPLKHPYTARSIAEVFCKEVVKLHGVPLSIVSDRDPIFISNFWKELFRMQGTQLRMSTTYHPETDGQTEVVNRCLETYLRCFISDQPKTWVAWIHWAEFWFNTNFHSATGKTPFEIVYGRLPPHVTRWVLGETRVEAVQRDLIDRDEALRQLKHQLLRAQEKMKNQADKKRVERSFMIGEWVFVKLRAHRQKSVVTRISAKLSARYYGPYPIIERVGAVAYKLKLPTGSKVHPVFHVSLLKKVVGNYDENEELPELMDEGENYEPEAVLATRKINQQGEEIKQVLVHWKGQTAEEATWEEVIMMRSQFPKFNLEDKVLVEGEGIDKTHLAESLPHEQLVHYDTAGHKIWKVFIDEKKGFVLGNDGVLLRYLG